MTFTIAFNYGGRAEIVDAVRALVDEGAPADKIDEKAIRRHLYDPEMPDPDLMIRTSGEYRISNFLLWEIAYSELVFTDVLWPDFRREHLFDAVREYQDRERRFGGRRAEPDRALPRRGRRAAHLQAGRGRPHRRARAPRGHGKVRAVAKGVRKTKSKFGAGLEPTSHVALQLYEGRELDIVTQAESIDHFRADPRRPRPPRPGHRRCSRRSTRWPRRASPTPGSTRCCSARCARSAERQPARSSCRPSSGSCWPLEGSDPQLDRCVGAATTEPLVAFDLDGRRAVPHVPAGHADQPEAVDLLRRILGGRLGAALDEPASPATHEVDHLATRALEHHLERRLRAVPCSTAGSGTAVCAQTRLAPRRSRE